MPFIPVMKLQTAFYVAFFFFQQHSGFCETHYCLKVNTFFRFYFLRPGTENKQKLNRAINYLTIFPKQKKKGKKKAKKLEDVAEGGSDELMDKMRCRCPLECECVFLKTRSSSRVSVQSASSLHVKSICRHCLYILDTYVHKRRTVEQKA